MTRASTPTLLSLDRWARIMNINPVHFSGAYATVWPRDKGACTDSWMQHSWQSNQLLSREDVAREIALAEDSIANVIGYWPAPKYVPDENLTFPKHYRKGLERGFYDISGNPHAFSLSKKRLVKLGRRVITTLSSAVAVAYTTEDSDSYDETATITATVDEDIPITELRIAYPGRGADETYFIRDPKSVSRSGTTVTFVYARYQMIDADLWEAYPTDTSDPQQVNLDLVPSVLSTVDIVRDVIDGTLPCATFKWTNRSSSCGVCGGAGCSQCTQTGCCLIENEKLSLVRPWPATYSTETKTWTYANPDYSQDPDSVNISYQSGQIADRYKLGFVYDPLDEILARSIAWLATARLSSVCGCLNIQEEKDDLRRDITTSTRGAQFTRIPDKSDVYTNPFGTRRGEVRAWQTVRQLVSQLNPIGGAA